MQEYFTGKSELRSLFNQSIESIPCLIYPFFFSLREVDHLLPNMLNLNGKNRSQNFFIKSSQFPFTSKDASANHLLASSASENGKRFHLNQASRTPSCCAVLYSIVNHLICLYGLSVSSPLKGFATAILMI